MQVLCQQSNAAVSAMHDAVQMLVQQHSAAAVAAAAAASGARVRLQHQGVHDQQQLPLFQGRVLSCISSSSISPAVTQQQAASTEQPAEVHTDHIVQTH
jgi:hypothetical protein